MAAGDTLEELIIVKYYQPANPFNAELDRDVKEENLDELQQTLKKFTRLERLNFCSSYFTIDVHREAVDQQNDQALAVTGNRFIELMFFNLKASLLEIHLGQWAYDDLIIYVSEICKELETVEINSVNVTDKSITEMLKKLKYLRFLDLSGCTNFVGVSFAEAIESEAGLGSSKIRQITLGPDFQGSTLQTIKTRIHSKQPEVVFQNNLQKEIYTKH